MDFNQTITHLLLPVLGSFGFRISEESKSLVIFTKDKFSVFVSFDYSFSKDLDLAVYYDLNNNEKLYLRDADLVSALGFHQQQAIEPEHDIIIKFIRFYAELFSLHGSFLFTEQGIQAVWAKTPLKLII